MKKILFIALLAASLLLPGIAQAKSDTLILYYTKTGNTGIVANELKAQIPSATLVEIKSDVSIMKAALWHQPFNRDADIEPLEVNPSDFDRIILCAPIWLQKVASPVRTVINTAPLQGKKVAVVVVCAGHFGEGGQERLQDQLAAKGIELISLDIIKTGDKTEEDIRMQARRHLQSIPLFATPAAP